jgi:hypothetical protein
MHAAAFHPELSLPLLRHEAERRLVPVARRSSARARLARTLLVWGNRLAPPERDGPPRRRLAATMVP